MKIAMDRYRLDECDHEVMLTEHCRRCEMQWRARPMGWVRRLGRAMAICLAAIRSAI